ncbi:hypothetical protein [Terribacillus saccharophilus]|uniref:Uncharacterized protein n=1 Tax=Terribacillus saccharophilus TaxID=361277 RepID=A0ABX4H070_9BACI|nr:hypothetical protein [Terribacillus saccharophilus]PAD35994.1 hypothetical protein CHH56_06105 [Terribacillus saccharophilus]PAD96955.1 hypothetical protein CHH50_06205 [Terribacillus saccharophilus]PAE00531.1 hypothetical protein CHH48_07110 [Terribacillus saccharophilus]
MKKTVVSSFVVLGLSFSIILNPYAADSIKAEEQPVSNQIVLEQAYENAQLGVADFEDKEEILNDIT